jgi:hypothetical protein
LRGLGPHDHRRHWLFCPLHVMSSCRFYPTVTVTATSAAADTVGATLAIAALGGSSS